MGRFVLGMFLGLVGFAFAAEASINPLCSMIQALAANWGIITMLVMLILGGIVVVSGIMSLIQGKFAFTLAVVIGGTVLLVASYRLIDNAGKQLNSLSTSCQGAQIEFVQPVAKAE
jgi:hypothetical protein